jgi:hypothetical protein
MDTPVLKPCPFCGTDWNDDLLDTLYMCSSWIYIWNNGKRFSERVRAGSPDADYHVWNIVCQLHNGGCGVTLEGYSRSTVVDKWNTRHYE